MLFNTHAHSLSGNNPVFHFIASYGVRLTSPPRVYSELVAKNRRELALPPTTHMHLGGTPKLSKIMHAISLLLSPVIFAEGEKVAK